ncbi:hypothetical protein quinque_011275 [Culex quinquefasciatus]
MSAEKCHVGYQNLGPVFSLPFPPKYQEACQKCLQLPACFVDVKLTVAFPTLAAMSYNPAPVPGGRCHP